VKIGFLLWDGDIGGAEVFTSELASATRALGADPCVLFVRQAGPLAERLDHVDIRWQALSLRRSRRVLRHPAKFAARCSEAAPDGMFLPAAGHLAIALRLGGYRAPVVAVEHGALLLLESLPAAERMVRGLERRVAVRLLDAEVGVSDYMVSEIRRKPHRRLVRIYNGVDPDRFVRPTDDVAPQPVDASACVIGCAGRLVAGKGIDFLLRAFAQIAGPFPGTRLRIAGDGPAADDLKRLAHSLGLSEAVAFLGPIDDVPAFWRDCHLAVVPSAGALESFGMAALEAMAASRPVVATRNGGIPEVVEDGVTGILVDQGNVQALAGALSRYLEAPDLMTAHGSAGRVRCQSRFHMRDCAEAYLRLLAALRRKSRPQPRIEPLARATPRLRSPLSPSAPPGTSPELR